MSERHPAIVNWAAIERSRPWIYDHHDEPMGFDAAFGHHFGFQRIGIHHQRLLPGRRTSLPHAESAGKKFVYVIAGTPDAWLDGVLYALQSGDAVGFPAGTGLAHTVINTSAADVEFLVIGDASKPENRIIYPLHPERKPLLSDWWDDAPAPALGPHDGVPDRQRYAQAKAK